MTEASHRTFIEQVFAEYDALTLPLHGRLAAEDKADGSSVTRADREASTLVVDRLQRYTPDAGVISEEEAQSLHPQAEWQWAIDPLDGTASFARGLPVWGLGIGLLERGDAFSGYMRFPAVNQTFVCEGGVGLLNGHGIARPRERVAADTRNVMITSIHDYVDVRRLRSFRFHNLGSNLYHLAMLGCGRCEAIITGPCYLWDLAPALPFTRAIGCTERYLDGSPLDLSRLLTPPYGFPIAQPMVVGPPATVDAILEALA